ncbi:hypothetical protein HGT70_14240 [Rosenbergiella collisarenosi]|uniref:hypothetical protein n=1 Tax=Rosenbergiella collisarenosi TaxID=1544695 RepID=UPI001BD97E4F|nr:hypothetical protein [Rosenbergiella collisarenosi]MBT0722434.1 hypothetical protein [Rosenbergiella collisarenosi]
MQFSEARNQQINSSYWSMRKDVVGSEIDLLTTVIAGGQFERALKLSGPGRLIAAELSRPVKYTELLHQLIQHYPHHSENELSVALRSMLRKFHEAGFIQADRASLDSLNLSDPARSQRRSLERWALPNPDLLAVRLARWVKKLPSLYRHLLLDLLVAAALFFLWQAIGHYAPLDHLVAVTPGTVLMVICLWMTWIASHELAHATVCRFYGFPVAGAGFMFRGFFVPSIYVNTSSVQLSSRRSLHFQVALAGPLSDLIFAGGCAAWMLIYDPLHPLFLVGEYASLGMVMGLFFNLTPFRASDGSSMYYALFSSASHLTPARGTLCRVSIGRLVFALWVVLYVMLVMVLLARMTGMLP